MEREANVLRVVSALEWVIIFHTRLGHASFTSLFFARVHKVYYPPWECGVMRILSWLLEHVASISLMISHISTATIRLNSGCIRDDLIIAPQGLVTTLGSDWAVFSFFAAIGSEVSSDDIQRRFTWPSELFIYRRANLWRELVLQISNSRKKVITKVNGQRMAAKDACLAWNFILFTEHHHSTTRRLTTQTDSRKIWKLFLWTRKNNSTQVTANNNVGW